MTPDAASSDAPDVPGEPARRARLRRHAFFAVVLLGGVVLRVLVQLAYQPAILFFDSVPYLNIVETLDPGASKPLGYPLLARAVLEVTGSLAVVAAVNHLLGLAMGVLIYVVLVRRGVWPWLAALATVPVLLEGFQALVEHMVMSDVLFQFLVVAGVAALLWRRRPDPATAALAGVAFASAALTRQVGQPLVLAGVLFCLLAAVGTRRRLTVALVHVLAFAVPLVGYASYHAHVHDEFTIPTGESARRVYARMATVADCDTLRMPAYERVLCPPPGEIVPKPKASTISAYTFGDPVDQLVPPPGMTVDEVLNDFSARVVRQQPLDVVQAVGGTFVRPFTAWTRTRGEDELAIERWRFRGGYPVFGKATPTLLARWDEAGSADRDLTGPLRFYQLHLGYTPGPALAGCLLLGVAGALGLGRARHSGQRAACLLWVVVGAGLLLSADLYQFSWRYQLPGLVTLPPAGALALAAMLRQRGNAHTMPVVHTLRFRPTAQTATESEALADFRARNAGTTLAPVVVVIPAYDEADSLGPVLDALPRTCDGLDIDVLVMSDGSTDDTAEVARAHGAYVCAFAHNVGQGTVLRHGYRLAADHGARYLVTTDADGQYDATDLPTVLTPVLTDQADFVIGSRRLGHHETDDPVRHLGVRVYARLVTLLTGQQLTDTSSGLRAFTARLALDVPLTQPQYQTSELLIGALARGYRVTERPSVMRKRTAGASKKGANWRYGLRYARVILGTWAREWPGRADARPLTAARDAPPSR